MSIFRQYATGLAFLAIAWMLSQRRDGFITRKTTLADLGAGLQSPQLRALSAPGFG